MKKQDNWIKVNSKEDIVEECRLFYELVKSPIVGYENLTEEELLQIPSWEVKMYKDTKTPLTKPVRTTIRSGKWKEIKSPIEFKKEDDRLDNPDYINHHNFHVQLKDKRA